MDRGPAKALVDVQEDCQGVFDTRVQPEGLKDERVELIIVVDTDEFGVPGLLDCYMEAAMEPCLAAPRATLEGTAGLQMPQSRCMSGRFGKIR